MGYFDYSREPKSDIAFVDMKSFYASVECVKRGLHPLKTSLCVMSRADNSTGLILASSPMFKKIFGKSNVGRAYDLSLISKRANFSYYNARKQGLPTDSDYVRYIEDWAQVTLIVPPRMDEYIAVNMEIQRIFQNYGSPDDIYPYSIDEGFIDLTSSLNYFIPDKSLSQRQAGSAFCSYPEGYLEADRGSTLRWVCPMPIPYWPSWLWIMRPSTLRP